MSDGCFYNWSLPCILECALRFASLALFGLTFPERGAMRGSVRSLIEKMRE